MLLGFASGVDVSLAVGGGYADGDVLEGAAESGHLVALEV